MLALRGKRSGMSWAAQKEGSHTSSFCGCKDLGEKVAGKVTSHRWFGGVARIEIHSARL
jgi:hypothetical protein